MQFYDAAVIGGQIVQKGPAVSLEQLAKISWMVRKVSMK